MLLRFILVLVLILPGMAIARPAPPPELFGMFGQLEGLEDALEEKKWPEAKDLAGKTTESFSQLAPILKKERPQQTEAAAKSLQALRAAIEERNFARAHASYIDAQQQLALVMDAFDYKIHPVIFLIDSYLKEAAEGFSEGNLQEVVNELHEIESLFDRKAKELFEGRGAAKAVTDRFADTVHVVRQAAAERKRDETEKGLAELSRLFTALARNFGSR